jgi:hypothetical protein
MSAFCALARHATSALRRNWGDAAMTDMIERVARASFECWRKRRVESGERPDLANATFDDVKGDEREFALLHAREVIAAMESLTDADAARVMAAWNELVADADEWPLGRFRWSWQRAIRAALAD